MASFLAKMEQFDKVASSFLDKAHQKQAKAYNKARQEGVNPYQVGERVLTLRPREKLQGKDKLGTVWEGPFLVAEVNGPHTITVQVGPNARKSFHLDQVKKFLEDILDRPTPLFWTAKSKSAAKSDESAEDSYDVEKILDDRVDADGVRRFLVRWEGYGPGEDSWEPAFQFFPNLCVPFMDYVQEKDITLKTVSYTHLRAHET